MKRQAFEPLHFSRGRHLYVIALLDEGIGGYVGFCDGRKIVAAPEAAMVARALIDALGSAAQQGQRRQQ